MKIAAIQMDAIFADVQANIEKVNLLIEQAVAGGAQIVVLPEFFTSAIAFSEKMTNVVLQNSGVTDILVKISKQYNIIIGGSMLLFDGHNAYNVFRLIFPNGQVYSHKKDLPTQFENCYYTKGDTANILHTPIGNIGVALCWEMLRYDTIRRLSGKVDVVFAGSCWWDLPDNAPPDKDKLRKYNQQLAAETPVTFAKLLHVPVIHGNHCGKITALSFPDNKTYQTRQFVGAAQIVDKGGTIISKRSFEQGEGMVFANLQWDITKREPISVDTSRFWIPDLPEYYINAWEKNNPIGEDYYKTVSLPLYKSLVQAAKIK